jgi:hypothetical protein
MYLKIDCPRCNIGTLIFQSNIHGYKCSCGVSVSIESFDNAMRGIRKLINSLRDDGYLIDNSLPAGITPSFIHGCIYKPKYTGMSVALGLVKIPEYGIGEFMMRAEVERQYERVVKEIDNQISVVITCPQWCPMFLFRFVHKHFIRVIEVNK